MAISEITHYVCNVVFIIIVLIFLFAFIYPNFQSSGGPHYNCNSRFEVEAQNIAAAIADYFAEPHRTRIPSIRDLVNSGSYTLVENRHSKHGAKLVRDSEFSVAILGEDASEITIVLSARKERCPFDKGKCPRFFKGEVYVKKMEFEGAGHASDEEGWILNTSYCSKIMQ